MRRKTLHPNNPTPTKALVPTLKSERDGRQGARAATSKMPRALKSNKNSS